MRSDARWAESVKIAIEPAQYPPMSYATMKKRETKEAKQSCVQASWLFLEIAASLCFKFISGLHYESGDLTLVSSSLRCTFLFLMPDSAIVDLLIENNLMATFVIPWEYPLTLLSIVLLCLMGIIMGYVVVVPARLKAFPKEFMM